MTELGTEDKRHPWNQSFEWKIPPGPYRALTAAQAEQFDRDGFVVLPDIFDSETVAKVTAELDGFEAKMEAFLHGQPDGRVAIAESGAITFTAQLLRRSELLRRFATQQVFLDLCLDLLGPDVNTYWDQAVYKKPRAESPFPWHQDNGYNFVEPQSYVTCWIAINDATEDNGCPWVVPGLHRRGTLAHERTPLGFQCVEDPPGAVCAPARAGSIVVFSSLTPHATGPNRTDHSRKAYIIQYSHGVTQRVAIDEETGERTTEVQADPERQFMILESGHAPRQ